MGRAFWTKAVPTGVPVWLAIQGIAVKTVSTGTVHDQPPGLSLMHSLLGMSLLCRFGHRA